MPFVSERQRKWYFATHKGVSFSRKDSEENNLFFKNEKILRPLAQISKRLVPVIVPPSVQIVYTAYKIIDTGLKLYKIYNQLQSQNNLSSDITLSLIKGGASKGVRKISEPIISSIAQEVRKSAENTGIIKQMSRNTNIDKDVYSSMLEGTLKKQMLSGVENFTSYTIGGLIG